MLVHDNLDGIDVPIGQAQEYTLWEALWCLKCPTIKLNDNCGKFKVTESS